MSTSKALVKFSGANEVTEAIGNNVIVSPPLVARNGRSANREAPQLASASPVLTNEVVNDILRGRGLGGWLRAANVARVLGLLSLYLYLDSYDIRANFNRRLAVRKREQARTSGRKARFQEWALDAARRLLDKLTRALRLLIFRGAEGSERKEARLVKQAVW